MKFTVDFQRHKFIFSFFVSHHRIRLFFVEYVFLSASGTHAPPHQAMRRRCDVVMTSLCTSEQRRRYVPNETPNDVSLERRQDDVLLECPDDVLKGRNNNIPSVRLHDVLNKSEMKHPTTSQRYITKTSQSFVSTTSHYYAPATSPVSPKWTPNNIGVIRLHHVSELRCFDGLYIFKLLCHELNHRIKHQIFLVPTRRKTIKVVWIKN